MQVSFAWAERWIPAEFGDPLSAGFVRARVLLVLTVLWAALCAWSVAYQLLRGAPAFSVVALGSLLLAASAPLLLWRTGSLAVAGNALTLAPFLGLTAANVASGGQAVASAIFLAFVPLVAALVAGRASACAWTAAVCVELLFLPWLTAQGVPTLIQPNAEAAQAAIYRAPLLGALLLLAGVFAYEAVTERGFRMSRLYHRLQRGEQRTLRFAETVPDGICTTRDDVVEYANPALLQLLRVGSPDAVRGRRLLDFVHPDDHAAMARLAVGGEREGAAKGCEIRLVSQGGTTCDVEVTMSGTVGLAGLERFYVLRDLTKRKLLEEQVRQSQKMEAIGQLAGGVAHDFNNLLTVILGGTGLLLADPEVTSGEERRRELEAIRNAGERSAALTNQLLAFGRQQLLQPRVFDLNEVVASMGEMLRRLVPETIRIETALEDPPPLAKADPVQLEQVILNLVLNARDAAARRISLTTETVPPGALGASVQLTVSDDGCGMDPETRERAFDPFFTTKCKESGTGLGLSTVHGIVLQSGGEIELESEPNRGATFRIRFPAVLDVEREARVRAPNANLRPAAGHETVLLVEDEPNVRRLAARILRSAGYDVVEACDGQEALDIAAQRTAPIDVLVSDIVMPNVGGAELAERLIKENPDLPVLFISGYAGASPLRAGGERHVVLRKPFTARQLIAETRRVLESGLESGLETALETGVAEGGRASDRGP